MKETDNNGRKSGWSLKEKLLTFFGMTLIGAEFINAEVLSGTFHPEFLLAGITLCGAAIALRGDKN